MIKFNLVAVSNENKAVIYNHYFKSINRLRKKIKWYQNNGGSFTYFWSFFDEKSRKFVVKKIKDDNEDLFQLSC